MNLPLVIVVASFALPRLCEKLFFAKVFGINSASNAVRKFEIAGGKAECYLILPDCIVLIPCIMQLFHVNRNIHDDYIGQRKKALNYQAVSCPETTAIGTGMWRVLHCEVWQADM